MNGLDSVDIKTSVANSVNEIFDKMLSMNVEIFDTESQENIDDKKIVGAVSFTGDVMGWMSIHVSDCFAHLITASMLGMEIDEIEGEEEIHDVIGELSNMIGGNLKSLFCDTGFPCQLSVPSITSGSDFKIDPAGWMKSERISFRHQKHIAYVKVYTKPGN
jgi:CheY-specific phosphatase CheX